MIQRKGHDLSYDYGRLDLDELIHVAHIAVGAMRHEVERDLGELQNAYVYHRDDEPERITKRAADDLAEHAKSLHAAAETLYYLVNCRARRRVDVTLDGYLLNGDESLNELLGLDKK